MPMRAGLPHRQRMSKPQTTPQPAQGHSPPPPPADLANRLTLRWILLGPVGIGLSVCLIVSGVFGEHVSALEAIAAIACGWAAALGLTPWRRLRELRHEQSLIAKLTVRLDRAMHGQRNEPLSRIIIDRDDPLGQLSRVIHDALTQGLAHRAEARMLLRTMDDSIRRETTRATADLQRLATTDPLTGLGNRRMLEQRLSELLPSNRAGAAPIAVMAIDLDRFKQINDRLGHDVGDRCLIFVGNLLKSSLRREDCAVRVGGDEFIVLMPGRTLEQAQAVAGRLKSLFSQMPWPHETVRAPGLSIGVVATHPGRRIDADALIRSADEAMYAAKRAARAA